MNRNANLAFQVSSLLKLFSHMKLIQFLLASSFLLLSVFATAQSQAIQVTGQVISERTQQPLEFATIKVIDPSNDQLITGTSTDLEGNFSVVVNATNFVIEIGFIGFINRTLADFDLAKGKLNLGAIELAENAEQLDEVVVRAEKSQTEFKLDKRVFNVGQDLSSTGASALEILNNVPSVSVNIEGQISLRGSSGVQILINGKPSVLAKRGGSALGSITADMIDRIEVITNPSAKYDAAGTTGILNIVLKKEEKEGINGSVTVNTGVPHNHSVGLSLNRRTERFNLFSQLGVGYRELPRIEENINTDLRTNTSIASEGEEFRNETFYNLILGTDYIINDLNILTLSGYFAYEIEDQPSSFDFSRIDGNGTITDRWNRTEVTEATNPKIQYELQYKKDFKDSDEHNFLFSALGNFFGKDQSSDFTNTNFVGNFAGGNQQTRTNFNQATYTFKADYTKPITEKVTLETGAQYIVQDADNDFAVSDFKNDVWVLDEGLTNVFDFNQGVLGGYATGAFEDEKWGVKLGLRVENTSLETLLQNTNERNTQDYTNLFPTLHTSYKINERFSAQAGYSKRIDRPSLWSLNPFFNIRNNFNIRQGNPDLQPEFTDSYELTGIYILEKASFNFGVYHLYTTGVVERISFFQDNVNVSRPINIGTNRSTGVEVNAKYTPAKWLSFNGDFNYRYFNRLGELEGRSFDFSADEWTSRLMAKFKLPAQFDLELIGNYQSAVQNVQGQRSDFLFADLGARKKLLKGKAVISLSVRDIFTSQIFESEIFQDDFYAYSYGLRGRFVTLGFSYGFGKGEAMEYGGGRRRF